jgi:FkbM family methyltransferase
MLDANPASTVIAYEPFAGNHRYFTQLIGDDARVTLRPVAVADRPGQSPFVVPRVVGAGETGWAKDLQGYSPLGHLGAGGPGQRSCVETVTLGEEIDRPIRFLKIDVQGGELAVLRGARLSDGPGVDIIYVEFNGSRPMLELLRGHGYVVFDCAYMAWPTRRYYRNWARRPPERLGLAGWRIVERGVMSSGRPVAHGWPPARPRDFGAYCAWFFAHRLLLSGLQTDLLCVRRDFLPMVWRAQTQLAAA